MELAAMPLLTRSSPITTSLDVLKSPEVLRAGKYRSECSGWGRHKFVTARRMLNGPFTTCLRYSFPVLDVTLLTVEMTYGVFEAGAVKHRKPPLDAPLDLGRAERLVKPRLDFCGSVREMRAFQRARVILGGLGSCRGLESSFDNRIFRCLVISPAGRAIRDFRSIPELLEALRDAIKAHRSLYTAGKILHRDISENNIIITDPKEADGFTGCISISPFRRCSKCFYPDWSTASRVYL
jgi:Fungal protein kinase